MPLQADRCGDGQKVRLAQLRARRHCKKKKRQDDSTKLQAQIADEQQQRNADGPPLGALVVNVDVGDREVGARRVGCPVHVKSRAKSILVEENGTVVLGGDVDVLRKGSARDEACTFLNTDYVPWSVEVSCQGTTRVPGEDLELVTLSPGCADQDQEQD